MSDAKRLARAVRPERAQEAIDLARTIWPLLAGVKPEIQGAVIADLLAMWLAGHHIHRNKMATQNLHDEMLEMHNILVRELIPLNANIAVITP